MANIDIDLDDLANLLREEVDYTASFTAYEKEALIDLRNSINEKIPMEGEKPDNLADLMKLEFLNEMTPKYTEAQLREMEAEYRFNHNLK